MQAAGLLAFGQSAPGRAKVVITVRATAAVSDGMTVAGVASRDLRSSVPRSCETTSVSLR